MKKKGESTLGDIMYTQIGTCPQCGSPIYTYMIWHGTIPPPSIRSCQCVRDDYQITIDTDTVTPNYMGGTGRAQQCPVCFGKGKVANEEYGNSTGAQREITCHGCQGLGWVTVRD